MILITAFIFIIIINILFIINIISIILLLFFQLLLLLSLHLAGKVSRTKPNGNKKRTDLH